MDYIAKLEIQYFRSIYKVIINDFKSLNVFTGKNDVGKSNVLKALNLFFNNETEEGTPFVFEENFNKRRLEEVRRDSIKGKQYIQIKVTFNRGTRAEKTLPEQFTVTKKWFRNDTTPSSIADDLERRLAAKGLKYSDRNKSSLTGFLNRIKYTYIPAIKDSTTFQNILNQLRETIYNEKLQSDANLIKSMQLLSTRISTAAEDLNQEFEIATGIPTYLTSPQTVSDLYRSLGIETKDMDASSIKLDLRGDGIRVRYLPSILYFIAMNSNLFHIWGFEEPENSLEYNLAQSMATDFHNVYCKKSMIFVTSHSPAFIGLDDQLNAVIYRCFREDNTTKVLTLFEAKKQLNKYPPLAEELGYIALQKEVNLELQKRINELQAITTQKNKLEKELISMQKPVVYTEGKTDVSIIQTAWDRLYPEVECPFLVKSCDLYDAERAESSAGCGVLENLLKSTRPDNPHVFIGLFDNDTEGQKAYKLDKNFIEDSQGYKKHKNGKSYALLLPPSPGKEQFVDSGNLNIEFYFERSDLEREVNGKRLGLIPPIIEEKIRGKVIGRRQGSEFHHFTIDDSTKVYFAEEIVPSFRPESFVNFSTLFNKLLTILE